jgi:putative transposase
MIEGLHISQRRACSYAGLSRTSYRQPPATNETTQALSDRIVELAYQRRRFGYRRIHDLLTREGCAVNHKRLWRLHKLNALAVRQRRKSRRVSLERTPLQPSRHVNDT